MTGTSLSDDRFEERLLSELRAHVAREAGARAAEASTPSAGRRVARPRRPARIALAGLAVGAAAATVVVATGGDGSAPAYAVERQGDGSVSVTIRSLSDADGLERELRAAGLRAEVAALPAGETCDIAPAAGPAPGGEDAQGARSAQGTAGTHSAQDARATRGGGPSTSSVMRTDDGSTVFTIDPGTLGAGDTVVITTSRPADAPAGADASTISMAVTPGPVPACVTDR